MRNETIQLDEISITVTWKAIKNTHLRVHSPDGRVTLSVPRAIRLEAVRAYAISKRVWIREQQKKLAHQARETPRHFVEGENHLVWGRPYLLTIEYKDTKPSVMLSDTHLILTVRPGCPPEKRAEVIHAWHKSLLHTAVPALIQEWEKKLNVRVSGYFLQRMKTRWGSCNYVKRHIRLNTELVKKPKDLLEYVIVHELAHLIEHTHNARFIAVLDKHCPTWREAHARLNALPLASEVWTR